MGNIPLPSKIEIKTDKENKNIGILSIEPCFPGYGITIGNVLRRVLLSSLEGTAATNVKIKGAQHEFSTIPHVKEDVLQIIANLKKLRLKVFKDEPIKLNLKATGEKEVSASDIEKNSDVEIINKDLKIATLTNRNAELDMELTVEKGLGYVNVEQQEAKQQEEREIGTIIIDSVFSPMTNVGIKIENVRVGQMTNYEKLILTIETDSTITVEDAVQKSAGILIDHFDFISKMGKIEKKEKEETVDNEVEEDGKKDEENKKNSKK